MDDESIRQTIFYHETTKHNYHRYARGPGYMDWSSQPDPFRRFSGAPVVYLPAIVADESPPYREIFKPGAVPPEPLTAHGVSRFLELSLAVSAWKQAGDVRWALRSNPSSGNLHPTEGYLVLPSVEGFDAGSGVYHYCAREHALERRAGFSAETWSGLTRGFPPGTFLAGLTSIHWREAWKYGERAFRYCQHDVGHALAAYRVASATLGWNAVLLEEMDDPGLSRLFGIDREADFQGAEREHPDLVCAVFPNTARAETILGLDPAAVSKIAGGEWAGRANRLSHDARAWDIIDAVAHATWKSGGTVSLKSPCRVTGFDRERETVGLCEGIPSARSERVTARQIVRQRRSAVAFDGMTHIDAREFYRILSHTAPLMSPNVPWDVIAWSPRIHFCLFVHRVRGLPPGLYFLVRDPEKLGRLKSAFKLEFAWEEPDGCPAGLGLYLLQKGDFRGLATQVSCTQGIAGDGAFSLGMIAEFSASLEEYGAWFYRRLFWESGMAGQALYLAAEEAGVRGTGIGCYFDDPVHQILGIEGNAFQSLYHFTVGGPVEDGRLTTLPAYPWSR
ncbi:MAG: nitroreductase family protein [Nitrospinae bacterium]|nr:nitroreductase family protein [Nitrospinota bacterium]